jgi:hypothetical protein
MAGREPCRLREYFLPPVGDGMSLESAVLTSYKVDWSFLEEDLLAPALGVRAPVSRQVAFRSELERKLARCEVTVLYDLRAADREPRLSPQIDPIAVAAPKLHAKVSLLLWSAPVPDGEPRRHVRLLVGSANLTRPGFRENYEVVAALDYGMRASASAQVLRDAAQLVRAIAGSPPPRLAAQLDRFERFADGVRNSEAEDQPLRLVTAENLLATMQDAWGRHRRERPSAIVIASPFWPEGADPAGPIVELVQRFGEPDEVRLLCQAEPATVSGALIPVLPNALPRDLEARLRCKVIIQPSRWEIGTEDKAGGEPGEITEDDAMAGGVAAKTDVRRALHAKVIAVRGANGTVLYVGSSNCTRRGLGLSRQGAALNAANWEAGLVYRLPSRRSRIVDELLRFAGPPIEVRADQPLITKEPEREPDPPAPVFLEEIVANGAVLGIRFRTGEPIPDDLTLLMPDQRDRDRFWLVYRRVPGEAPGLAARVALETCQVVNLSLEVAEAEPFALAAMSPWVDVQWQGVAARFPVRFDDKTALPPPPGQRRLTEGELIDYFLYGYEPGGGDGVGGTPHHPAPPDPRRVDTQRILSYFVRRFVEAIPGIEADIAAAWHSRPALNATLTGPTGVLTLATEAALGVKAFRRDDEPVKTPIAAGFQVVEIIAALQRCRDRAPTDEARDVLAEAVDRCRGLLVDLCAQHPELGESGFARYRRRISPE